MSRSIAVINAGSSSVKFALYDTEVPERCSFRGQVEGIGVKPCLKVGDADGRVIEERDVAAQGFDYGAAMREIMRRDAHSSKEGRSRPSVTEWSTAASSTTLPSA